MITAGSSGSPVLLLSGGGIDSALLSWRRLIPELATCHWVIAPDWPKQGRSREWHGTADHQALLRTVDAIITALELEAVSIVGLSQGGALGIAYAIEHPERVRRLVAIAPGGISAFPPVMHQLLWLTAKLPTLTAAVTSRTLRSRTTVERFVRRR